MRLQHRTASAIHGRLPHEHPRGWVRLLEMGMMPIFQRHEIAGIPAQEGERLAKRCERFHQFENALVIAQTNIEQGGVYPVISNGCKRVSY
jgi:hypothetical protein